MKTRSIGSFCLLGFASLFVPFQSAQAQDFTWDGKPDIVWRRTNGTDTWLWQMTGTNFLNSFYLGSTAGDVNWKVVGFGDFDQDGQTDLLWRHTVLEQTAVWYMRTNHQIKDTAPLTNYADPTWRIVGAGDFGSATNGIPSKERDGWPDIIWQNWNTDQKAIWLMQGLQLKYAGMLDSSSIGWKIVTVGDFGSPTGPAPDGKADLVLESEVAGSLAIRFMDGPFQFPNVLDQLVWVPNANRRVYLDDIDKQIVGAADYLGNGRTHLLVRNVSDGRNYVWQMDGTNWWSERELNQHTYDIPWRVATQELTNSVWRLHPDNYNPLLVSAAAVNSTRIDLQLTDGPLGATWIIKRTASGAGNWQTLASNWSQSIYQDSSVTPGILYDYRISSYPSDALFQIITAGTEVLPATTQGRLLLVVEQTLASNLGSSLTDLIGDLAADGWNVIAKTDAARHHDVWDDFDATQVGVVKSWLSSQYTAYPDVKSVLILGHVVTPYSGTLATDQHGDHTGPWTADAYYGDFVGPAWTVSANGAFSNDSLPSPLEVTVGRIDFGHLPTRGTDSYSTSAAEVALIQQYLVKDDRYRRAQVTFGEHAIYSTYFHFSATQDTARGGANALWGTYASKLDIGDAFRNSATFHDPAVMPVQSYKFGFVDAPGHRDAVYYIPEEPVSWYTTQTLRDSLEAPIAFYTLMGSYFADFGLADSFTRSVLGKPDFGLAVIPSSQVGGNPTWSFERMALGEPIGATFLASVNAASSRQFGFRWLNFQGDPTLRLNALTPPVLGACIRTNGFVTLNWTPGESAPKSYLYRGSSLSGPFDLLSIVAAPPWTYTRPDDDPNKRCFLVRGAKLAYTGRGSYWNLSSGSAADLR